MKLDVENLVITTSSSIRGSLDVELEAKLEALADKVRRHAEILETEEASKFALVNPFIEALGFDLSNPSEAESFAYAGLELREEIDRRKAEEERLRQEMQERMNQPRERRQFQRPAQGEFPEGIPQGGGQVTTRRQPAAGSTNPGGE